MKITRYLFTFAAIWALLAGIVILLLPGGTSVTETAIGADPSEMAATPISYFKTQGWWGIWMLFAFATIYYGPLHFYHRSSRGLAALFAVAAVILSVLAGFSIGLFYFPAALALLIGLGLLFILPKSKV